MPCDQPHIVHLSGVHRATDTRVFVKECLSAASHGYRVTLVARADHDSTISGVRIKAVPSYRNRLMRLLCAPAFVYRAAMELDGDVYQFHDAELMPVCLLLKRKGKVVIYDVHESTGKQILSKDWIPGPLRRPVALVTSMLERYSSRSFDAIVAATPPIATRFDRNKTVVVRNFAKNEEFESISNEDYLERPETAVYVGSLTGARGIRQMIAAGLLVTKPIQIRIGGDTSGIREIIGDGSQLPGTVTLLGRLDRDRVREEYSRARVGLCVLQPVPNYLDALPVKMFEYMAAGLPVIASRFPYWEQFITNHDAGIMVDPTDPEEIAEAITWIINHPEEGRSMGERGRHVALDQFSWRSEERALLDVYGKLVGSGRTRKQAG